MEDPLAKQPGHFDCLCWDCYRNGRHLPTEMTAAACAAAVADGTITTGPDGIELHPLIAEARATGMFELEEAESARLKLVAWLGNTRNDIGTYWRLCANACRKAARLGLTNEQIARFLDISVEHVDKCWMGCPTEVQQKARELFSEGHSVRSVAKQTGLNAKTATRIAEATGAVPRKRAVPSEELKALDELLVAGWNAVEARRFVVEKWPDLGNRLTINYARVRASRIKKRMAVA